jgi:hypothetical protein
MEVIKYMDNPIVIAIPCKICKHHELFETNYSDINDCYTLLCPNCKQERHIHYTVYDCIIEDIEDSKIFESTACETIKMLHKHCSMYASVSIENSVLQEKGKLIQKIEYFSGTVEYYEIDENYFYIGRDTRKYFANTIKDMEEMNNYILKIA